MARLKGLTDWLGKGSLKCPHEDIALWNFRTLGIKKKHSQQHAERILKGHV